MTEDQLHFAVVEWLNLALPEGCVFHHSPNEVRATAAWHQKQKKLGRRAGWPDIEIVVPKEHRATDGPGLVFVELKSATGTVPKAQRDLHEALKQAGAAVGVCRSIEAVEEFLGLYIKTKARVAA